jgi:hypothetical protein
MQSRMRALRHHRKWTISSASHADKGRWRGGEGARAEEQEEGSGGGEREKKEKEQKKKHLISARCSSSSRESRRGGGGGGGVGQKEEKKILRFHALPRCVTRSNCTLQLTIISFSVPATAGEPSSLPSPTRIARQREVSRSPRYRE